MEINTIENMNIQGSRILIRVDYNVPINNGLVIDDYRILCSMKTIKYCLANESSKR